MTGRRDDETKEAEEIEVTPEMIKAGVSAYYDWDRRIEEPEGLVIAILEAALSLELYSPDCPEET